MQVRGLFQWEINNNTRWSIGFVAMVNCILIDAVQWFRTVHVQNMFKVCLTGTSQPESSIHGVNSIYLSVLYRNGKAI